MAKKQKKERASEPAGRSTLENAFAAYQQGDVVTARKGAQLVLAKAEPADEDFAKKTLGKELFAPEKEVSAAEAAKELLARTRPFPKAYIFAGLTAAVYLLMLFIAHRY